MTIDELIKEGDRIISAIKSVPNALGRIDRPEDALSDEEMSNLDLWRRHVLHYLTTNECTEEYEEVDNMECESNMVHGGVNKLNIQKIVNILKCLRL